MSRLPLPHPYLPGDQTPDSFEDKVQQNFDKLALAVGGLNSSGADRSRTIWGVVIDGATATGTGWSMVRNATGDYTVTLTTAFTSTPAYVVTPHYGTNAVIAWRINAQDADSFQVVFTDSSNTAVNTNFNFHAIGPR